MPRLPGGGPAGAARPPGGTAGQMFDKTKAEMIRPWFRQAAVPRKTTATQTRASGENRVSTKPGVLQMPVLSIFDQSGLADECDSLPDLSGRESHSSV